MKTCRECHRHYDLVDIRDALQAMGFGKDGSEVDEDYLILIDGLCPDCWPEYS